MDSSGIIWMNEDGPFELTYWAILFGIVMFWIGVGAHLNGIWAEWPSWR